jgi:hypothetical protein
VKKLRTNRPMIPEFSAALRAAEIDERRPQPLCKGRDEFISYQTAPQKAEARAMCAPCPLLSLCNASARHQRPAWGVQGGIAWERGRQSHWLKKTP